MFKNIRAEMARKGMTNQDVADHLGISRNAYGQKLKSGRFIPLQCNILCKLFNCNYDYLFKIEESTQQVSSSGTKIL